MTQKISRYFGVFLLGLLLVLPLASTQASNKTRLIGNWKSTDSAVTLNIRANGSYRYKLKVLDIKGQWQTSGNKLTLNYSLLGVKKKRVSTYRFDGADLILKSTGKPEVRLKRRK